jgi:DNA oxidative demethylase
MRPLSLLDDLTAPEGFQYHRDFLTGDEEARLLDEIRRLEFHEVRMRGVAAKRRVVQYGWKYSFESFRTSEGPPLPEFLMQVQQRAAALAGVAPDQLSEALITEYSPGAAIGWHRDAPPFGIVIGISLLAACRFRFRRGRTGAWDRAELTLEPRSAYVLTGPARYDWQHSIPAVDALRYSVTFRTMALESRSRQE